jgi:hypothetical protein
MKHKSIMSYRKVDGFCGNVRTFLNSLCPYFVAVFLMYVKLCSIFLFNEGGKVILYAVAYFI